MPIETRSNSAEGKYTLIKVSAADLDSGVDIRYYSSLPTSLDIQCQASGDIYSDVYIKRIYVSDLVSGLSLGYNNDLGCSLIVYEHLHNKMTASVFLQKITPHDGTLVDNIVLDPRNQTYSIGGSEYQYKYEPLNPAISYGVSSKNIHDVVGHRVDAKTASPTRLTATLRMQSNDFDVVLQHAIQYGKSKRITRSPKGYSFTAQRISGKTCNLAYDHQRRYVHLGLSLVKAKGINRMKSTNSTGLSLSDMYLRAANTSFNLNSIADPHQKTGPRIEFISDGDRAPAEHEGNAVEVDYQNVIEGVPNARNYNTNHPIHFIRPILGLTGDKGSRDGLLYNSPEVALESHYILRNRLLKWYSDFTYASKYEIGHVVSKMGVASKSAEYQSRSINYGSTFNLILVRPLVNFGDRGKDAGLDHYPDFGRRLSSSIFLDGLDVDDIHKRLYGIEVLKDATNPRYPKTALEMDVLSLYGNLELQPYSFNRGSLLDFNVYKVGDRNPASWKYGYGALPYEFEQSESPIMQRLYLRNILELMDSTIPSYGVQTKREPFEAVSILTPTYTLPNRNLEYSSDFGGLKEYDYFHIVNKESRFGNMLEPEYIPYGISTERPDYVGTSIYTIPYFNTLDLCAESKPNYDTLRTVHRVKPLYYVQII